MSDWARSLVVLVTAFLAVVATTLGLAFAIVPGPTLPSQGSPEPDTAGGSPDPRALDPDPVEAGGIPGLGGTLTVTGDRTGSFRLTRQAELGGAFGLEGDDGRIIFQGQPAEVSQASFDGLQFFPDPDDCTVSPGNLDDRIGIGFAELECPELTDIRGNGIIGLSGELGMPLNVLAARPFPESGGTLQVGPETWQIGETWLATWAQPVLAGNRQYNLVMADDALEASLGFDYDTQTHELSLAAVRVGEVENPVSDGACQLRRTELGKWSPQITVSELEVACSEVDVPGLGAVPISGTVVVDELAFPR